MADSNAVRSRRKRLHAAGDHSECRRCGARGPLTAVPPPGTPTGTRLDPRASLEALAARLATASEADPADVGVGRLLKDVLLALGAAPGREGGGELGAFLARIRG